MKASPPPLQAIMRASILFLLALLFTQASATFYEQIYYKMMADGRVEEMGPPALLLERGGTFAELVRESGAGQI